MMKKLIAIAIAAGMAAPAMADTTLYGQLHASVDALSGATDSTSVSTNSSRIGVKGSAELNGGLKAIYQAEWGMDTGGKDNDGTTKSKATAITNRNQVVGVAGGFGAVLLGRHDTPFKIVGRKADLFWSTQLGQNRNIVNPGAWDLRPNNVIAYQSPKIGGFQALAAYVTDLGVTAGADDKTDSTAFSINGIYNAGPLMVGAAYETHDLGANALGAGKSADRNAIRLMGAYKFGAAKVVGFYQKESDVGFANGIDADVYGIGGSYKVSPSGTIKAQYYTRSEDKVKDDGKLIAVGYDHSLGKKTAVYAQFAKTENTGGIGGAGHGEKMAADNGGDADGFSFGIRHKF
jgi:predicted porin